MHDDDRPKLGVALEEHARIIESEKCCRTAACIIQRDLRTIRLVAFRAANGFLPSEPSVHPVPADPRTGVFTVLEDPMFTVTAVALNHRIPSFAYSLEERFHINVNKQKLHDAALPVGGWLKDVKHYVWEGKPDDFRFTAVLFDEHRRIEREFVLG